MTRILAIFCVGAVALAVSACDGIGRKYPPGYTDDGIKFEENGWRYWPSNKWARISYTPTIGVVEQVMLTCELQKENAPLSEMLDLEFLEIRTREFEPLQQWPQPDLIVRIGTGQAGQQATLDPSKDGNPAISVKIGGRTRSQMLMAIHAGMPITLSFADQTREIPGPPQSMREAFADKCRGER